MKKRKKILLGLLLSVLFIPNVYAITSNDVTYGSDTVKNALDELYDIYSRF